VGQRTRNTVVIIDDDPLVRDALRCFLGIKGFNTIEFVDGESFKESMNEIKAQVAILDLNLPGIGGMELLPLLRNELNIPTIVYTGENSLALAQEATTIGAYEFLSKPVKGEFLLPVIRNAIENEKLKQENINLRRSSDGKYGFANLIGISKPMQNVFGIIKQIAPGNATVLVRGGTGTGKDLVAEAIHNNSGRASFPFIPINCAALSPSLAESTLFGHEKGAFTGATTNHKGLLDQAKGGTLFLDEIGSMPLDLQAKLLRLLEDKHFQRLGGTKELKSNVRFVAATNSDLEGKIKNGTFREDLYFRLNAISIKLPELTDRRIDIPHLAMHFLRAAEKELGRTISGFAPEAHQQMMNHSWPGNVRELRHSVEYAAALCQTKLVEYLPVNLSACCLQTTFPANGHLSTMRGLPEEYLKGPREEFFAEEPYSSKSVVPYDKARESLLECFDKEYFSELLTNCRGNIKAASKLSGIPYRTLHRKLKTLKIERADYLL
jgi:DNA-binding NtrC family response regulator